MTRLHLIRHGHTDALGQMLSGRAPIGLSPRGRAEAQGAARALAGTKVDAILSSPQPRARQTADVLAAALGLSVQEEAALDEVDFGAWSGQRFNALEACPDWQAWNRLRSLAPSPGETMLAAQARIVALVQRLCAAHEAQLVLVSHADVVRALLAHLLGMPIDLMHRIELSPAGRSVVTLFEADIRVEAVNLPPALP